ncbi:hypothetical protein ZWY2020_016711 [Hordeum vulgare]|nr:hypothetical protein ZWY2020_016711 [Hordeum vulgare]
MCLANLGSHSAIWNCALLNSNSNPRLHSCRLLPINLLPFLPTAPLPDLPPQIPARVASPAASRALPSRRSAPAGFQLEEFGSPPPPPPPLLGLLGAEIHRGLSSRTQSDVILSSSDNE